MRVNENESSEAHKGDEITLRVPTLVRRNDKVYLIEHIPV
jgi:hypothetical protein